MYETTDVFRKYLIKNAYLARNYIFSLVGGVAKLNRPSETDHELLQQYAPVNIVIQFNNYNYCDKHHKNLPEIKKYKNNRMINYLFHVLFS